MGLSVQEWLHLNSNGNKYGRFESLINFNANLYKMMILIEHEVTSTCI